MFRELANKNAVATLIVVQIVSAINWYAASSVFSLIATDLNQDVSGLGLITSAFTLGVGLFQLPAGIVAAKQGPKKALLYGVFMISTFSILSGFVTQLVLLAVLRFFVGIGEAFIFGPGVILMARYFRRGSEGLSLGIFGSAFDLGGIVGISIWAILGTLLGWRVTIATGGVLALIVGVLLLAVVPSDPVGGDFFVRFSELKTILFNRSVLLASSGLLSVQVAFGLSAYFTVYYLERSLGVDPTFAGIIGSLGLAASVVTSPLGGRIFDRIPSPKRLFIAFCLISAAALAVSSVRSPYAAIVSTLIVGGATGGGFVFGIGIVRAMGNVRKEYEAFGLAWVNGIGLFGGVWTPLVFSALAAGSGYAVAWILSGAFVTVLVVPLLALRSEIGT